MEQPKKAEEQVTAPKAVVEKIEKPNMTRTMTREGNDYKLHIHKEKEQLDIYQTFTKDSLKDTYKNHLKVQEQGFTAQLSQVNKALKAVEEIELDEGLIKLKEQLTNLQKLDQKDKLVENKTALTKNLKEIHQHMKEIQIAIPEVMRAKK